jgi:hypothetical protein
MNSPFNPFPLRGRRIGISISGGDENAIPSGEDPEAFINRLTFQTCSRFLYLGATIVLGHRWKRGGIMEHLAYKAADFRHSFSRSNSGTRRSPVLNYFAWPDLPPKLNDEEQDRLASFLEIEEVPPPGIATEKLDPKCPLGQFARTRALTELRHRLVSESDLRICIGGRPTRERRRLPGVLEEALFTYQAGQPLFLAGALGGATRALCNAILPRRLTDEEKLLFYTPVEAVHLFEQFAKDYPFPPDDGPSAPNSTFDALQVASAISVESLSQRTGISKDEYLMLMTTPDVGRALELIGFALGNLPAPGVS